MKKKLSRQEIQDLIKNIFSQSNPSIKEIKKIKKLAMSKNIRIRDYREKFCKKCYSFFNSENSKIRIKKPFKIIFCKNCGFISRIKLNKHKI
ncbi:MAG: hypothetical protein QXW97_00430 [Candidatus Pacearchaeota archaeon]